MDTNHNGSARLIPLTYSMRFSSSQPMRKSVRRRVRRLVNLRSDGVPYGAVGESGIILYFHTATSSCTVWCRFTIGRLVAGFLLSLFKNILQKRRERKV